MLSKIIDRIIKSLNNKVENQLEKYKTQHTNDKDNDMTIKLNKMIRYLLLQFVNIADGDLPTKFSSALKT